jgi:hypothetical protein
MDFKSKGQTLATTTYSLHILDEDGLPLYVTEEDGKLSLTVEETDRPVIWEIVSQFSAQFKRRKAEVYNWNQANRDKRVKHSESEQQNFATLAAAVASWKNTPWDGAEMEFSAENVQKLIAAWPPAGEQVLEAMADRGNFAKSA